MLTLFKAARDKNFCPSPDIQRSNASTPLLAGEIKSDCCACCPSGCTCRRSMLATGAGLAVGEIAFIPIEMTILNTCPTCCCGDPCCAVCGLMLLFTLICGADSAIVLTGTRTNPGNIAINGNSDSKVAAPAQPLIRIEPIANPSDHTIACSSAAAGSLFGSTERRSLLTPMEVDANDPNRKKGMKAPTAFRG